MSQVQQSARSDPTGTSSLRNRLAQRFRSRWRDVRGANREYIRGFTSEGLDSRALRSYREWFRSEVRQDVVEPAATSDVAAGHHWTAPYIRQAYDAGLDDAREELRALEEDERVVRKATTVSTEQHRETLRREFLSGYYEAEDVGSRMQTLATRALVDGLQQDAAPGTLASEVNAEIQSYGESATNALANTVVVETFNEAKLTAYEASQTVSAVGVEVEARGSGPRTNAASHAAAHGLRANAAGELEFQTAGDLRVCPECAAAAGGAVPIERARSTPSLVPPLHPNCRCRLVPTAMSTGGEEAPAHGGDPAQVTEGGEPISEAEEDP